VPVCSEHSTASRAALAVRRCSHPQQIVTHKESRLMRRRGGVVTVPKKRSSGRPSLSN
jgi:hypothetical protein